MDAARMLRTARQQAGLSQAELARRSGVPQPVVSAYERGRREPSVRALVRLLGASGHRLSVVPVPGPAIDPEMAGRRLVDVLSLADALPTRPAARLLPFPRLPPRPQAERS